VGHARKRTYHDRKMDEVERLAEMERQRYDNIFIPGRLV